MATAAENKLLKRRSILDAATRLFTDKSVAETAIDEVVQLAGVAKGTFYLYFRDKYDLLDEIVMHRTADIVADGCRTLRKALLQKSMTAAQQFIFLTDYIVAYLQRNKKVTALIDKRFSACFTEKMLNENESFREAVEYLTGLLISESCPAQQARKKLYILTDMIGSVCCDAVLGEKPYGIRDILPTLYGVLHGILDGGEPA